MDYDIKFKDDETLDACGLKGDWALVRTASTTVIYLRESARAKSAEDAADVLKAAWAGFRDMLNGH